MIVVRADGLELNFNIEPPSGAVHRSQVENDLLAGCVFLAKVRVGDGERGDLLLPVYPSRALSNGIKVGSLSIAPKTILKRISLSNPWLDITLV